MPESHGEPLGERSVSKLCPALHTQTPPAIPHCGLVGASAWEREGETEREQKNAHQPPRYANTRHQTGAAYNLLQHHKHSTPGHRPVTGTPQSFSSLRQLDYIIIYPCTQLLSLPAVRPAATNTTTLPASAPHTSLLVRDRLNQRLSLLQFTSRLRLFFPFQLPCGCIGAWGSRGKWGRGNGGGGGRGLGRGMWGEDSYNVYRPYLCQKTNTTAEVSLLCPYLQLDVGLCCRSHRVSSSTIKTPNLGAREKEMKDADLWQVAQAHSGRHPHHHLTFILSVSVNPQSNVHQTWQKIVLGKKEKKKSVHFLNKLK